MELSHIARRRGRLSSFLREEMGMSAGLVNRLKWKQLLFVNEVPRHTDYTVVPGDRIRVQLETPAIGYDPEPGPLTVLYEDDHLLAVDKPAGMLIHPSRCQNGGTLANRVLHYYQKTGQTCAFHPVTRLDRDTFGIVLLAKNSHIHARMSRLREEEQLEKIYHALVFGVPDGPEGVVDAPIARRPLPSLLREIREDGKPSLTRYGLLYTRDTYAKLWLQPVTGRTHQLRLHCLYAGFPILGDPQYCTPESAAHSRQLQLSSQLLCAARLSFPHPVSGGELTIHSRLDASLPGDFRQNGESANFPLVNP